MKYDLLYNFISPLTGKIPIDRGYILLGDKNGISYSSPVLIDVRQDIIDLKRQIGNFEELKKLDYSKIWIGDYDNEAYPQLHIGIINLPPLAEAVFPNPISPTIGDFRIPNPTFDYTSPFDWVMSGPFLPQIYATKYDTSGNPLGTDISSSLAMTQVRAAQIMKRFDNANFIVGSSTVTFAWENPKMYLIPQVLKDLYGLGTTYTFTKAQSLGNLETGLLKNTVTDGTGTLSKAISGEDYVNTADIPVGNLVILDPLYPLSGHKLIAPTQFTTRGNEANEFGYPTANTIKVLTGTSSSYTKLAITSIAAGSLIKISNNFGELIPAVKDTDYISPDSIDFKFEKIISIIKLLVGVNDAVDFFSITTSQASNLNKIVKTIGGVQSNIDMVDVTITQASQLTNAVKNAVGLGNTADIFDTASKAADVYTNKSALVELEAQIAALAGVVAISDLVGIFAIGALAVTGYNYGQYIKGQSLNTKNTWFSVDDNDDASNATGELRPFQITPFKNENRGRGTLWFDSNDRGSGRTDYNAEGGIRVFSWDSSPKGSRNELAPVHIGLFGYRKNYTVADEYKGFIFRSEFSDDTDGPNYRFPTKFGLYDVYKSIHSYISGMKYGWQNMNAIFEYDYSNFNFYKPVVLKEYTRFEKEVEFQANIKCSGTGALKIPVGNTSQRPSNLEVGMIRFNTNL